jgi:hypothetical protein
MYNSISNFVLTRLHHFGRSRRPRWYAAIHLVSAIVGIVTALGLGYLAFDGTDEWIAQDLREAAGELREERSQLTDMGSVARQLGALQATVEALERDSAANKGSLAEIRDRMSELDSMLPQLPPLNPEDLSRQGPTK